MLTARLAAAAAVGWLWSDLKTPFSRVLEWCKPCGVIIILWASVNEVSARSVEQPKHVRVNNAHIDIEGEFSDADAVHFFGGEDFESINLSARLDAGRQLLAHLGALVVSPAAGAGVEWEPGAVAALTKQPPEELLSGVTEILLNFRYTPEMP